MLFQVLFYNGKEALREVVQNAEMYPIRGLFKFNDFFQDIDKFYDGNVIDLGISTGWDGLDKYYKVTKMFFHNGNNVEIKCPYYFSFIGTKLIYIIVSDCTDASTN
jgi:hypothetical protein